MINEIKLTVILHISPEKINLQLSKLRSTAFFLLIFHVILNVTVPGARDGPGDSTEVLPRLRKRVRAARTTLLVALCGVRTSYVNMTDNGTNNMN